MIDSVVIVDWSARSAPSPAPPSPDAIWWCIARHRNGRAKADEPVYARTRADALERIAALVAQERAAGLRVLVGFDFPFGYPAGVAGRIAGAPRALALWSWLADAVEDDARNRNNRFEVAERINRHFDGTGPMWGRPGDADHPDLPVTARERRGEEHPPERRLADGRATGAKTVWQLAYAGSVGSQMLLGLSALERLRRDERLTGARVWPLETGLAAPDAPVVLAEVYPSLIRGSVAAGARPHEIADCAQVRVNAAAFAQLAAEDALEPLFEGPADLSTDERAVIEGEEAWILGLGHEAALAAAAGRAMSAEAERGSPAPAAAAGEAPPAPLRYERDPAAIYRHSFATVRAEARLDHLPEDLQAVAVRLVHACGMTDVPNRLAWSDDLAGAARAALQAGATVLCDCEMVASGVIQARLPAANAVVCTLNDGGVPERARAIGNTRSAAAVELWAERLAGAVVAIGNAPTALFHLLELIDRGAPRPAAILGFPVGFVGAAESKAELARDPRGVPFLTLRGRRGGSAIAAAAVNALASGPEARQ